MGDQGDSEINEVIVSEMIESTLWSGSIHPEKVEELSRDIMAEVQRMRERDGEA